MRLAGHLQNHQNINNHDPTTTHWSNWLFHNNGGWSRKNMKLKVNMQKYSGAGLLEKYIERIFQQ